MEKEVGAMIRYLLMTSLFIYGGLLLLSASTFMTTDASVSDDFDQPQPYNFDHKYLKVVSLKEGAPSPPPSLASNIPSRHDDIHRFAVARFVLPRRSDLSIPRIPRTWIPRKPRPRIRLPSPPPPRQ